MKLFKEGLSVKDAVAEFYGRKNLEAMLQSLEYSEEAIKMVLYDPEIAPRALYLNSVRLPPLVHMFWDYVTVTDYIISYCNLFAENKLRSIEAAEDGLASVRQMKQFGKKLGLPYDYEFHYDTFELVYYCRKLIYGKDKETVFKEFSKKLARYRETHPGTYRFNVTLQSTNVKKPLQYILKILIRDGKQYRPIDHFIFNRFTAIILRLMFRMTRKQFPAFIDKQSMPLDALLS